MTIKRTVVIYGFAMAALLGLLKYLEYSYMVRDFTVEAYMGIIALLFTVLGIWIGLKLIGDKKKSETTGNIATNIPDNKLIESLGISKREHDVLKLIAEGCSNQEIADRLFVTVSTVKTHSSNLFTKLDVKRRTQAVKKAKSLNII